MASRLPVQDLLLNPSRFLLLAAIRHRPGLCQSECLDALRAQPDLAAQAGPGMLAHHLRHLNRGGLVVSIKEGRHRHYYPREVVRDFRLDHVALMENPLARAVAATVLEWPGAHQAEVARRALQRAAMTGKTVYNYLRRLEARRLIQRTGRGRLVCYHPTPPLLTAIRWFDNVVPGIPDSPARSPKGTLAEAAPPWIS